MKYRDIETISEEEKKDDDNVIYDVKVDDSIGCLMTKKCWLDSVQCGAFIDYDGFGDMLNAQGNMIGRISPSTSKEWKSEATHILWYNR